MYREHVTHVKLISQNPNIGDTELAKVMGVGTERVASIRAKYGLIKNKGRVNSRIGIPFLCFDIDNSGWVIRAKINGIRVYIGSSNILEKAVGILDAYLSAVRAGYLKQQG